MREIARVEFETTGAAADRRLVREYVLDAVARLPDTAACDRVGYAPQGQVPSDGGAVLLFLEGDIDAVVERERDRWDALVDAGLALDWAVIDGTDRFVDIFGERGGELYLRLHHAASRMSAVVFEEFDAPPAAVDAHPDEDGSVETGWWSLLHQLTVHQGYALEDELAAYERCLEHTLDNIAEHESPERAVARIDEIVAALEDRRAATAKGGPDDRVDE